MKTALTIAGSDCSGGAGIQADIKTMTAYGVYAMSAITALTAQNTLGVQGVLEVEPDFLRLQLESVFSDIVPDAVKTGMVSSPEMMDVIADVMEKYGVKNLVVDPVMIATSGAQLIPEPAVERMRERLLPLARVITPNIPEAEVLWGHPIEGRKGMEEAAKWIAQEYGCAVLVKGGHNAEDASDLLLDQGKMTWFNGERIHNPNSHGTGCTLSSAMASGLAKGLKLEEAVTSAKEYVTKALAAMLDLGEGSGPLNHCFAIKEKS